MNTVVNSGQTLAQVLAQASESELADLANVLTDNGEGRYSMSSETLKKIQEHQAAGTLHLIWDVLEEELLDFGGHSVTNLMRLSPIEAIRVNKLDYHEIVLDVAKKMDCKHLDGLDTFELEERIFKADREAMEPKPGSVPSPDGPSTFDAVKGNAVVIGGAAVSLAKSNTVRSVLSFAASKVPALASGTAATVVAPIAAAVGTAYAVYEVGSPASRVTKPAVMKVALIRRRLIDEQINELQTELKKCL